MTEKQAIEAIESIGAEATAFREVIIVHFPEGGPQTSMHMDESGQYTAIGLAKAVFIVSQAHGMRFERKLIRAAAKELFETLGLKNNQLNQ